MYEAAVAMIDPRLGRPNLAAHPYYPDTCRESYRQPALSNSERTGDSDFGFQLSSNCRQGGLKDIGFANVFSSFAGTS